MTGSPVATTASCLGSTLEFFSQAVKLFMPSLKLGLGQQLAWPACLPHYQSHQTRWAPPPSWEPLFLTYGSQLFSGMFLLEMECIGIVLLSTGFLLPKFQGLFVPGKVRNSLFRTRPLVFGVIALRLYFRRPRPPSPLAGFCSTPPDGKCYLCLYTRVMRTFRFGPIRFLHVAF